MRPGHGKERVTIDWVVVGAVQDAIHQVLSRTNTLIAHPDNHFAGLSVRRDGENGQTFLCQVQYDDTEHTQ